MENKADGLSVALNCNHGRWLGEAQFGACVACINAAMVKSVAQARREEAEEIAKLAESITQKNYRNSRCRDEEHNFCGYDRPCRYLKDKPCEYAEAIRARIK